MPNFCFYDRCSFELVLSRSIEAKLPGNNNENSLQISQIQKVDLDESCSGPDAPDPDKSCSTPPKRDSKVIEEEMKMAKESGNELKSELEKHLKSLKVENVDEGSPKQAQEQILKNPLDDAVEQSSFLD